MTKSIPFRSLFNKTFWISAVFLLMKTLLSESILNLSSKNFRLNFIQMSNYTPAQSAVILGLEILVVLLLALTVSRFGLMSQRGGMTLLVILLLTDQTYTIFEVSPQIFFYYDFYEYVFHAVSVILFLAAVFTLFHGPAKVVVPAVIFISLTLSVSSLFGTVPSLILLSYVLSLSGRDAAQVDSISEKRFKTIASASAVAVVTGIVANYLFNRFIYSGYSNGNRLLFLNMIKIYAQQIGKALLCCLPVFAVSLLILCRAKDKGKKTVRNKILSLVVLSYAISQAGALFCNNFWFLTTVSITPLLILMTACADDFVLNVGAQAADAVERVDGFFRKKPYWFVLIILLMYVTASFAVTVNSSII